jgi:hypothetical protein
VIIMFLPSNSTRKLSRRVEGRKGRGRGREEGGGRRAERRMRGGGREGAYHVRKLQQGDNHVPSFKFHQEAFKECGGTEGERERERREEGGGRRAERRMRGGRREGAYHVRKLQQGYNQVRPPQLQQTI